MSTTYRAVAWNPQKRRYDLVAAGLIVGVSCRVRSRVQATLRPELTIETLLIRALGAAAFTLLQRHPLHRPAGAIGPPVSAAALQPSPSRRDDVHARARRTACSRSSSSTALGTLNPLVSVLVSNARYTTISQLPFQPFGLAALVILFLMAATSHDFWLHNLTAPGVEDAAHGRVRGLCAHRAARDLRRPAGRDQPAPGWTLVRWRVDGLHAARAWRRGRRRRRDRENRESAESTDSSTSAAWTRFPKNARSSRVCQASASRSFATTARSRRSRTSVSTRTARSAKAASSTAASCARGMGTSTCPTRARRRRRSPRRCRRSTCAWWPDASSCTRSRIRQGRASSPRSSMWPGGPEDAEA